jgi:hypothetical protein
MKRITHVLLTVSLFSLTAMAQNEQALWTVKATKKVSNFGRYQEVEINNAAIEKIYYSTENYIQLPFADINGNVMMADMVLKPMEKVKVKTNNKQYRSDILIPKTFAGKIRNAAYGSNILLTIAPRYISVQAYLDNENILLEPDKRNLNEFVLIHTPDIVYKQKPWECGMTDDMSVAKKTQRTLSAASPLASADKCVFVFVDCSNALYSNQGSDVQSTINYVYSIWNNLRTSYANEQMNVLISEINVWTGRDSFDASGSSFAANLSFANFYKDNYWGNMAMLLDWSNVNGGIAGGYGWAKSLSPNTCGNYDTSRTPVWNFGSFAYCNLNGGGTFINAPVPTLDWQIEVCIHELGHLFSSWHTHSCRWPGGAIDNCVAVEAISGNPPCTPGPAPTNGGTIMSYCHLSSVGINFNNGFGTLPGDTIRQFVVNNSCISNCTSCITNDVIGNIVVTSFQQKEVTNQLIANGNLTTPNGFLKLDAGSKIILQPGFRVTAGNKVQAIIDGCGGIR